MRTLVVIIAAVASLSNSFAQQDEWLTIPDFAPRSPEAHAFLKYGDTKINYSRGMPDISVPLYSLAAGDFVLPVELRYDSSGIKVSQEATWVGLGWNLSAGAQIILDQRDTPDEYVDELMPSDSYVETVFDETEPWNIMAPAVQQLMNKSWIKDVFYFSSPTVNGKFIIGDSENANKVIIYPPDSFKVELIGQSQNRRFVVTDKFGNRYIFDSTKEKSNMVGVSGSVEWTSSWLVDKIVTAKNHEIFFTYAYDGYLSTTNYNDKVQATVTTVPGCPSFTSIISQPVTTPANSMTIVKTYKLASITYKDQKIVFERAVGRDDLASPSQIAQSFYPNLNIPPTRLQFVKVQYKELNTYITKKGYEFQYSYFETGGSLPYLCKRLKLDAVKDIVSDESTKFQYFATALPAKDSKKTDAYGYYNGKSNLSFVPDQNIYLPGVYSSFSIGTADRTVSESLYKACMLQKIIYPLKGSTEFVFENKGFLGTGISALTAVSSGAVYGTGYPNQNPVPIINANDDDLFCDPTQPTVCVSQNIVPFNAGPNPVSAKLSYTIVYNGAGQSNKEYARVQVHSSPDLSGFSTSKVDQSFALSDLTVMIKGSGYLQIEAYGATMAVTGAVLTFQGSSSVPTNQPGPGARIAQIINRNEDQVITSKRTFSYTEFGTSNSSGREIIQSARKFDGVAKVALSTYSCQYNSEPPHFYLTYKETQSYNWSGQSIYHQSNDVSYTNVTETFVDYANMQNNNSVEYTYSYLPAYSSYDGSLRVEYDWLRGELLNKKIKDNNSKIVEEETYEYANDLAKVSTIAHFKLYSKWIYASNPSAEFHHDVSLDNLENAGFRDNIPWHYLKSHKKSNKFYSGNDLQGVVDVKTDYFYDNPNHMQLTRVESANSNGIIDKTVSSYPGDAAVASEPFVAELVTRNMIGSPMRKKTYSGSDLILEERMEYQATASSLPGINNILPYLFTKSKDGSTFYEAARFTYDSFGNPEKIVKDSFDTTYLIWGYNRTLPIVFLKGNTPNPNLITYRSNVDSATGSNGTSSALNAVFNSIRSDTSLQSYQIKTYEYIPMRGMSKAIDEKLEATQFVYDSNSRLIKTVNSSGKIISENVYHLIPN